MLNWDDSSRHLGLSQAPTIGSFAVRRDHIGLVPHEIRISLPILMAFAQANPPISADFPDQTTFRGVFFVSGVIEIVPQYLLFWFSSGLTETADEV